MARSALRFCEKRRGLRKETRLKLAGHTLEAARMSRRTCVALLVVAAVHAWQAGEEPRDELRDKERRDNTKWLSPAERKEAEQAGECSDKQ